MAIKVTFTLDDETIMRLQQAAERLSKPKSEVVREAVREYHARIGRLSESERVRLLQVFDEFVPRIPSRPIAEVERELAQLRASRRRGGSRRHAVERRR
jgi:hypothetical protein